MKFDRRFDDVHVNTRSFSAFTVAALVMLILRLTGVAHISFWWIIGVWLAPLIILLGVVAVFGLIALIAIIIAAICKI